MHQLLTPAEASKIYDISEDELLLLAKSGKIGHYYFGRKMIRFNHDHLLKYLDPSYLTEKEREEKVTLDRLREQAEAKQQEIELKKDEEQKARMELLVLERAFSEAISLFNLIGRGSIYCTNGYWRVAINLPGEEYSRQIFKTKWEAEKWLYKIRNQENYKELPYKWMKYKVQLQELLDQIYVLTRSRNKIDKIECERLKEDFCMRIAAKFVDTKKRVKGGDSKKYYLRIKRMRVTQNRRAKIRTNGGIVTPKEWIEICDHWGNKCLCCGKPGDYRTLTMDHVKPVKLGGKHIASNIQPLCQSCNSRKHIQEIDYRTL